MNELDLQDKYLVNFICDRADGLGYREVKANTVSPQFFIIEDLKYFISETSLNKENYRKLVRKFNTEKELMDKIIETLNQRIKESMNMAIFFNGNKTITIDGIKLHLFYPSGSVVEEDNLFDENLFSVVQELPSKYHFDGQLKYSFRPDLTFFLNGIYLSYSELKSNYTNQTAQKHGIRKVAKDYQKAVEEYLTLAASNDVSKTIRNAMLKVFEKGIHITATDLSDTFIIRSIVAHFDSIKNEDAQYEEKLLKDFKKYPILTKSEDRRTRFEEVFRALYDKKMIEKEILYYNFIERELIKKDGSKTKEYHHNDGKLISPRPKQKFGTDKTLHKINEFLKHEKEPDYLINKFKADLKAHGVGAAQIEDLVAKRSKYQNNKNVYSLLMQYAAGFGKSNIIGWTALQLKDLRKDGQYVYDKVMIVVDRLQLRDQIDSKMQNMNIQKSLFIEADSQKTFKEALSSDKRVVVVNLQKFNTIKDVLDGDVLQKLTELRIAFLIDEIHRSNSGEQHEEMVSLFDELQSSFDNNKAYTQKRKKKNLIIGFTATPSDHTLARFGEFSKYAENMPIWIPFDSYTMKEAIEDGFILNPIRGIVPVAAKMYFDLPDNELEGFEGDIGYEAIPDDTDTGIDANGKKYAIRKKKIYENEDRIEAISKFVVERLVSSVYDKIRGTAKAMFAVSSIKAAIKYKKCIDKHFAKIVQEKKYERFKDAPIYIVYSESQDNQSPNKLNNNQTEEKVLQNFAIKKNGLIIVVDKLQTGFDEPKLHTLFLDKEIKGINAIQTISRVNRTTKYKNDCKIVDFSYKNVNVQNIKKSFEHFSNVVVSDFDPINDENKMDMIYEELNKHALFVKYFKDFVQYENDKDPNKAIDVILDLQNNFALYIRNFADDAKDTKANINAYFKILNLIEFVITIDPKYNNAHFLKFWRKFNSEYNSINKQGDIIDDVEIYFDNKIGITVPLDVKEKEKKKKDVHGVSKKSDEKQYKFDILKVIEKRNQEEEAIEAKIKDFEAKIELLFEYIRTDDSGRRLIAKMKDGGSAFDAEEIYTDFTNIYRKFIRRNKDLSDFFKRETSDTLNQICDDFSKTLKVKVAPLYKVEDNDLAIAADE